MEYTAFKNELENYYHNLKNIDRLKEDIELIVYEMSGVKGIRYDKQPMAYNPELSEEKRSELSEKLEEKELELENAIASIKYVEKKLSKLSDEDREICLRIISEGASSEKVAFEKGYSRGGMWKRIKRELSKIL